METLVDFQARRAAPKKPSPKPITGAPVKLDAKTRRLIETIKSFKGLKATR